MKNTLPLLLLAIGFYAQGQQTETSARFAVTQAISNGEDESTAYIKKKQSLRIYRNEKKQWCFSNGAGTTSEISYGQLFALNGDKATWTLPATTNENLQFRWKYLNNYDTETGYSLLSISKTNDPSGRAYYFKIITQDGDLYTYTANLVGDKN
jgi:hypothetical protein